MPSGVADYKKDGFALFRAKIPQADLDSTADDICGVFSRRAPVIGLTVPERADHDGISQLLLDLFAADRASYLAAARQTQYLASVHAIGLSAPIFGALAELGIAVPSQSTRPVIHFIADGLRIEGGYPQNAGTPGLAQRTRQPRRSGHLAASI